MKRIRDYYQFLLGSAFCLLAHSAVALSGVAAQEGEAVYQSHCASCHGAQRLGGMGPALLPSVMARIDKKQALSIIEKGRAATQMPTFAGSVSLSERQALVDFIFTEPEHVPIWQQSEITNSQLIYHPFGSLSDKPVFKADLQNLFIVVELADHSATLLNGENMRPVTRFKTRRALHGGPKYSPDGRYVFFASRDGWISKYDMYNLKVVAETRAGINTRNLAVSSDGNFVLVGNYLPNSLVLLDARNLDLVKVFKVEDAKGTVSRVSAVYNAPPRKSFIAALKDVNEIWEIPYAIGSTALPVHEGDWIHDFRSDSGESEPLDVNRFPVRRIPVQGYLDDFFFDDSYRHLIGTSRDGNNAQVINLDAGMKVAEIALSGMPHLGSAITWPYQGREVMVTPNFKEGLVSVIDMSNWEVIKTIKTDGPGFFARSHPNSRYAWVDVFFGPNNDRIHVIDKKTLEIVTTLRPEPGKTSAHIEFTKDGKYALLSIWDNDGAVIVYDADTLHEVTRIPMKKPSGKYNVHNKTGYLRGTSH